MSKKNLSSSKLLLKSTYSVKQEWGPFYTGGHVLVSSNGQYLFCCCGDKVQILDIDSGLVEKALIHDGDEVTCFAVSPDNRTIITAAASLLLKQWDWMEEVKCVRTWKAIHVSSVRCMDFDSSSTLLATGGSDGTIKVWDLSHQYCTHNFKGSPGVISIVRFHPHTLTLYSAADDYNIREWDLTTSKCTHMLESHVSAVTSLKFTANDTLVSGGRDSIVCLWNVPGMNSATNQHPIKTIPVFESLEDLVILPNDKAYSNPYLVKPSQKNDFYFITAGNKGVLKIWSSCSGKCVFYNETKIDQHLDHTGYTRVMKLPDINQVVAVTNDHHFDFINIDSLDVKKHLVGYNDEVLDLKFCGENEKQMIVVTNSPHIKVFDMCSSACQLLKGHTDTVLCVDVFADKTLFASSSKDNSIRLWKLNSESVHCVAVGNGHTRAVGCIAACKFATEFVVSGSQDHTMKIWNVKHAKTNTNFHVKITVLAHEKDINSIAVAPNDKLVATGSQDKLAKLWSVQDGKHLGTFQGHKRGIWCVQFSPMDQVLATSSADGTVKIWALSHFTCLKTLEGYDCSVLKVIFIAKGTQLITSGSDGLLKLWTVKNSECVQTLDRHNDKVWALCSNSDDEVVISGDADSIILIWEDVTEKFKAKDIEKNHNVMMHLQEMQNLLHERRFKKALHFAIKLEQPFTALTVVKEILWEDNGMKILEQNLCGLRPDQKQTLFKFVVTWNTNSRNCHEAQALLRTLLATTAPIDIESYQDSQSTVESLLPYTDRHFERISCIAQQATFLDYTWDVMKIKPQDFM